MIRLDDILSGLDLLAEAGDNAARHAAALLRGQRCPGRKPINDNEALAEVERLTAAGKRRAAVSIVAARMADDPKQQHAIAQRLRDRLRKQKCSK
jgi:hypothetical protein